jgi:hypothetical protein
MGRLYSRGPLSEIAAKSRAKAMTPRGPYCLRIIPPVALLRKPEATPDQVRGRLFRIML